MTEWRQMPWIAGDYSVSDDGQVRNNATDQILSPVSHRGYVVYSLTAGDGKRYQLAHRLVARAFIGEPTGPLVRHLDDVRNNNHVSNLAYGDYADNMRDALRNGRHHNAWTSDVCPNGHDMLGENAYFPPGGKPPACRECGRLRHRKSRARARARSLAGVTS